MECEIHCEDLLTTCAMGLELRRWVPLGFLHELPPWWRQTVKGNSHSIGKLLLVAKNTVTTDVAPNSGYVEMNFFRMIV